MPEAITTFNLFCVNRFLHIIIADSNRTIDEQKWSEINSFSSFGTFGNSNNWRGADCFYIKNNISFLLLMQFNKVIASQTKATESSIRDMVVLSLLCVCCHLVFFCCKTAPLCACSVYPLCVFIGQVWRKSPVGAIECTKIPAEWPFTDCGPHRPWWDQRGTKILVWFSLQIFCSWLEKSCKRNDHVTEWREDNLVIKEDTQVGRKGEPGVYKGWGIRLVYVGTCLGLWDVWCWMLQH